MVLVAHAAPADSHPAARIRLGDGASLGQRLIRQYHAQPLSNRPIDWHAR
ncbi:hypothetical protein [Sphingobium yanoikuyae]|nr:hypothetical protein [Sphingobium yanoikuyae]WBQ15474.1 hypothetical protein PAE53_16270 [Sphingobium yanoikuyae]